MMVGWLVLHHYVRVLAIGSTETEVHRSLIMSTHAKRWVGR
jgi:hypothetical protein